MRLLGVLTLAFAGSFAVAIVTIGWQDSQQSEAPRDLVSTALPGGGADGLMARTPVMRVAASVVDHR